MKSLSTSCYFFIVDFFRYEQNYTGKLNQKVNFIMIKAEGGSMKSSMIMVEILSKKKRFRVTLFAL